MGATTAAELSSLCHSVECGDRLWLCGCVSVVVQGPDSSSRLTGRSRCSYRRALCGVELLLCAGWWYVWYAAAMCWQCVRACFSRPIVKPHRRYTSFSAHCINRKYLHTPLPEASRTKAEILPRSNSTLKHFACRTVNDS